MAEYKWLEPVTVTPKRVIKKVERLGPAKTSSPPVASSDSTGWYLGLPWPKVDLNIPIPKLDPNAIDVRGPAVSAMDGGDSVYYQYKDGSIERRVNGSKSWRNNNPGNLRYSKTSVENGAIGSPRGMAIFPDFATGWKAKTQLLRKDYKGMTIQDAIARFAPAKDGNNPVAYAKFVAKRLGVPVDTVIDTSDEQLERFHDAIFKYEGYKPGESKPWPY